MAKDRSRSWIAVLALLLLGGLAAIGLVCRDRSARSGGTSPANAASQRSGTRAQPVAAEQEDPVEDGVAPDGLSLVGRVIYPDGRPAPAASVRLLSRPSGAPHLRMPRRMATTNPDGTFAFGKQAQGDYLLEAQTDDAVSPTTPARLLPGSEPVTLMVFPAATLAVRVYNAVDDRPIAGATVKLGIGDGLFGASDAYVQEQTDAAGIARFRGVAPIHNHPVFASADGFAGTYSNIVAFEHLSSTWDIALALEPGGQVSGRVVDERGVPIPGAKVGWEPGPGEPDGSYTFVTPLADGGHYIAAVTDSTGGFRKSVPPGTGCLVAVHPLHLTGQACGVRAAIGTPRAGVEIVMKSGARISGVVVTADGQPAPRAEVIVTHPSWEHESRLSDSYRSRTTTDAQGRFAFEGVDRMALAVTAWTDEASSELVEVDLRGASERKDVRIVLANTGVITGTVTEDDGGPAPFARVGYFIAPDVDKIVFARNEEGTRGLALPKSSGGTLCDADGTFRLAGLPAGKYTLRAMRPAATSVTAEFSAAWQYGVATGSSVTMVLPGLGAVTGRVVTDDDRPVSSFSVSFAIWDPGMKTDAMPPGAAVTSADGKFHIADIPAQRYSIAISGPGIVEWRSGAVELRAGSVTNLGTIRVAAGRTIVGRVLSRSGVPIAGADVAMIAGTDPTHAQSDGSGRFALRAVERGASVKVRASNEQVASDWVTVAPEMDRVDIVMNSLSNGSVRGVIFDPAHPVADRTVVLTLPGTGTPGDNLKPEATAHALDSGRFALENVPIGPYILWIRRAQGTVDEWATRAILVEGMKETSVVIDLSPEQP
jgi:hypothetical protein